MIEISSDKVVQVIFLMREGAAGEKQLHAFINGFNDDEKAHLTALAWVGRGAFEASAYDEAVATAFELARPSGVVVLAPACASFDMFRDYAHRAQVFCQAVADIAEAAGQVMESSL